MDNIDLLKILDNLNEHSNLPNENRYLIIDGLNLFFRNFSAINSVNSYGNHIGGLGGFFRSLGFLIKTISPTHVFIIFDGIGGSNNRKNLIPEYKSGRNTQRITNWDVFDNLEEEDDSKINQITRIIQYLKHLPVRTISLPKVEADDIIAYLSSKLIKNETDKVFIVSSDKDYLQLINDNISIYRPIEKELYTIETMREKYNMIPSNFILYKLLMGDNSDKITGIKGLGHKGLFKKFPELSTQELSLDDLLLICENKLKEHIVYARVLHDIDLLKTKYKIMDLKNPMVNEKEKKVLLEFLESKTPILNSLNFMRLYEADQLGGLIKNPNIWLEENFKNLK